MATIPKRLYLGQPGIALETIYTVPDGVKDIAIEIIIHNTTATDARLELHVVPQGGSANLANRIFGRKILSEDSLTWFIKGTFEAGDTIQAKQITSNALTVFMAAVEVD